jgi:hypothetical protein
MKVGKEEMMGLLVAVEMWLKRDHEGERRQMQCWVDHIAARVGKVAGVIADSSKPPRIQRLTSTEPTAQLAGQWALTLEFVSGRADHTLVIEQESTEIRGTHKGAFLTGDLRGYVDGHLIRFRSSHKYEGSYVNYTSAARSRTAACTDRSRT